SGTGKGGRPPTHRQTHFDVCLRLLLCHQKGGFGSVGKCYSEGALEKGEEAPADAPRLQGMDARSCSVRRCDDALPSGSRAVLQRKKCVERQNGRSAEAPLGDQPVKELSCSTVQKVQGRKGTPPNRSSLMMFFVG